jgi:cytochrome c-type biogenesis protein CcmF
VLWGTLFPVLSEWVQGHKVTVGPPFFNRVNIPIAMFLLLLTGVGPLLAWRSTSWGSLRKNFMIPALAFAVTAIALIALGVKPWTDAAHLYSLMAISLGALVTATIISEFVRGGRVISRHTGQNLFGSMITLTRRNTRRYGGYIVHFGVVVIVVGLAGSAFNEQKEQEMGFRDTMQIGRYTLVCDNYTQEDHPNYSTEYAMLDVYKDGKLIAQMFPERRFFKASQQASTMVANHSTPKEDLYVIYAGKNIDTDKPIIKAFVNPLVMWIWIGVFVLISGTVVALVPPMSAAAVPQAQRLRPTMIPVRVTREPVEAGD